MNNNNFRTSLLGAFNGYYYQLTLSYTESVILNSFITKGPVPQYNANVNIQTLEDIVAIFYITGEIDCILESRIKKDTPKIFATNDILFKCIPSHYSCDDCKSYHKKIKDIFKGTLLEMFFCEDILKVVDPVTTPFTYDFLILVGSIKNNKKKNPRNTNLLITRIDHLLHKENLFVLDILISNYGMEFISANNWYLNNTPLISDRFITLLLLEYDFDTTIFDTIIKSFDVDIEFIFNMVISKFNIEKGTFSYEVIKDPIMSLYKCLSFIYERTADESKDSLILRTCNSLTDNVTSIDVRWRFLDMIIALQQSFENPMVPIIYDDEPQGGYYVGKYFDIKRSKIHFDVIDSKTFVFYTGMTKVEENDRVVKIYKDIKDGVHPYLSFEQRKFNLYSYSPYMSNLVFHIYCDVSD